MNPHTDTTAQDGCDELSACEREPSFYSLGTAALMFCIVMACMLCLATAIAWARS